MWEDSLSCQVQVHPALYKQNGEQQLQKKSSATLLVIRMSSSWGLWTSDRVLIRHKTPITFPASKYVTEIVCTLAWQRARCMGLLPWLWKLQSHFSKTAVVRLPPERGPHLHRSPQSRRQLRRFITWVCRLGTSHHMRRKERENK